MENDLMKILAAAISGGASFGGVWKLLDYWLRNKQINVDAGLADRGEDRTDFTSIVKVLQEENERLRGENENLRERILNLEEDNVNLKARIIILEGKIEELANGNK